MTGTRDVAPPRRHLLHGDVSHLNFYDYTSGSDPSFSSQLNNGFFIPDDSNDDFHDDSIDGGTEPPTVVPKMVRDAVRLPPGDRYGRTLAREVTRAVETLASSTRKEGREVFLRAVMGYLRSAGYDAAVCKTRWGNRKGIIPGSYEYIDVVRLPPRKERRYIVDVYFAAAFGIARPTSEYERMVGELPEVYVGTAEEFKCAVTVLADAAKLSLKSRGLHIPPWRKKAYMRAKWFGPYQRTTNLAVAPAVVEPPAVVVRVAKADVACRTIGFEPLSHVAFPLAAETR